MPPQVRGTLSSRSRALSRVRLARRGRRERAAFLSEDQLSRVYDSAFFGNLERVPRYIESRGRVGIYSAPTRRASGRASHRDAPRDAHSNLPPLSRRRAPRWRSHHLAAVVPRLARLGAASWATAPPSSAFCRWPLGAPTNLSAESGDVERRGMAVWGVMSSARLVNHNTSNLSLEDRDPAHR